MKFLVITLVFAIGAFALYYWIYTMVHISKNKNLTSTEVVLWLFGAIFFPLFGTILYWIIGKNHHKSLSDDYRDNDIVPNPL